MNINFSSPIDSGTEDGIDWLTKAAPIYGAVNGYVTLPEGHPWRELDLQGEHYSAAQVHGGITYGPDVDGRIGFDTLHAGDHWPGSPYSLDGDRQWTPELVAEETQDLARQAAAALKAVKA